MATRVVVQTLNEIDSLSPGILASEAEVFTKFGSVEEQIGFAEMLESRFPMDPIALGTAGVIYLKLGDREKCGEMLVRSYALDSSNALTALNYGVYLVGGGSHSAALPVLKRSLELDQGSFLAAYYLATTYLALGDINNAKATILRAEAYSLRPEDEERLKKLN